MTSTDFLTHLSSRSRVSDLAAERVRRVETETTDRLAPVLLKLGLLSEADLAAEMAAYSGHPRIATDEVLRPADITKLGVTARSCVHISWCRLQKSIGARVRSRRDRFALPDPSAEEVERRKHLK